jgi:general stress protein YciG
LKPTAPPDGAFAIGRLLTETLEWKLFERSWIMADTSRRGFASMDAAKQREIASKGGKAAHAKGTAHEFSKEEAREAGRKGGASVSRNRQHMADIGREGGKR